MCKCSPRTRAKYGGSQDGAGAQKRREAHGPGAGCNDSAAILKDELAFWSSGPLPLFCAVLNFSVMYCQASHASPSGSQPIIVASCDDSVQPLPSLVRDDRGHLSGRRRTKRGKRTLTPCPFPAASRAMWAPALCVFDAVSCMPVTSHTCILIFVRSESKRSQHCTTNVQDRNRKYLGRTWRKPNVRFSRLSQQRLWYIVLCRRIGQSRTPSVAEKAL